MASSSSVMSTGVPNTAVVLIALRMPSVAYLAFSVFQNLIGSR